MRPLREIIGLKPSPPAMTSVGSRSFMFDDAQHAQQFVASMTSFRVAYGNDLLAYLRSSYYAEQHRGVMYRSTTGRETNTYGYAPLIFRNDREYLLDRDPTAGMLIEDPWKMLWNGLPMANIPDIDAYFAEQEALGLRNSLQAGYSEWYQEGGALVYLEATGDPMTPLRRGERPLGWTFVPASHVLSTDVGPFGYQLVQKGSPAALNPLLDHGIEYISFYPTEMAITSNVPMKVHGSRIIPINLDPKRQKWWRTTHIPFNKVYDTLWDWRDSIVTDARHRFQGDPIVVDVDLSADTQKLLAFDQMTEEQRKKMGTDMEQSIQKYNAGMKTTFAPVMGYKMRRLGAATLPDAREGNAQIAARLSHGSGIFTVNWILASTKGAFNIGDQDLLIVQGKLQNIRDTWGYTHIRKALLMGRIMGAGSLRMQETHDLPPPTELVWPLIRPLSPRDSAFTEKTDAAIARELQEMGKRLTPRLARKFPDDPTYPTPPWMAVRGRDKLGRNTDVDPKSEPGASDPSPDGAKPSATKPAKKASTLPIPDMQADELRDLISDEIEEQLEPVLQALNNLKTAVSVVD